MSQDMPDDVKETARMNNIAIQRGVVDYHVPEYDTPKPKLNPVRTNQKNNISGAEGYQNYFVTDTGLGETGPIVNGQCPEGYSRCSKTGKCIQKCIGCVYRDNMKSREFNEADPCFPEGTYNGVTNEGYIKCTCGNQNQYCSGDFVKNIFTPDGMMIAGQKIVMNVGNPNSVDSLFNFDYL
jgi:hypothetical protein